MYEALYLSPIIPTRNMDVTVRFFSEVMSFEIFMNEGKYAILQKDDLTLHLEKTADTIGAMEFYLEVDDVDSLWNSIKDKLAGVKFRDPFNQEYGMREFHIAVPETETLLYVGQEIA